MTEYFENEQLVRYGGVWILTFVALRFFLKDSFVSDVVEWFKWIREMVKFLWKLLFHIGFEMGAGTTPDIFRSKLGVWVADMTSLTLSPVAACRRHAAMVVRFQFHVRTYFFFFCSIIKTFRTHEIHVPIEKQTFIHFSVLFCRFLLRMNITSCWRTRVSA